MGDSIPVALLDGGLGTTLQAHPYNQIFDTTTPLWSSHLLLSNPKLLQAVHGDFIKAGADVVLTATYQASFEGFARTASQTSLSKSRNEDQPSSGDNESKVAEYMRTAVSIGKAALDDGQAWHRADLPFPTPAIALSLGPYGAITVPSQEYSGKYPSEMNNQAALRLWHTRRLAAYVTDPLVRKNVQLIAWETMQRTDEIMAVREVMSTLHNERELPQQDADWGVCWSPKWWITMVCPGEVKEKNVEAILRAMLADPNDSSRTGYHRSNSGGGHTVKTPPKSPVAPWGVGINCTSVEKIIAIVTYMEKTLAKMLQEGCYQSPLPWLVLYPNGSSDLKYDSTSMEWVSSGDQRDHRPWDEAVWEIVSNIRQRKNWGGVLVGGCCMTLPRDIKCLRQQLDGSARPNR